jgi:hypothetical protein
VKHGKRTRPEQKAPPAALKGHTPSAPPPSPKPSLHHDSMQDLERSTQ